MTVVRIRCGLIDPTPPGPARRGHPPPPRRLLRPRRTRPPPRALLGGRRHARANSAHRRLLVDDDLPHGALHRQRLSSAPRDARAYPRPLRPLARHPRADGGRLPCRPPRRTHEGPRPPHRLEHAAAVRPHAARRRPRAALTG